MPNELVKKLGVDSVPGSSIGIGVPYQNIPKLGLNGNRNKSDQRARRIMELVDMKDKTVYDFGCSVGTMSSVFAEKAKTVIGYDYDSAAIAVASSLYNSNASFHCLDLNDGILNEIKDGDIAVWTSQFNWMVNQQGIEKALDFLWKLSTKFEVLVFETACVGDGLAPIPYRQKDIIRFLILNTVYQDITDHGPWNDGWSPRHVFVCRNPFRGHESEWSEVKSVRRGVIEKRFQDNAYSMELKKRESEALRLCARAFQCYVPRILEETGTSIFMDYSGMKAKWIPEDDLKNIVLMLRDSGITHRDIRSDNLLWDGTKTILIDFSLSTFGNEMTNYHYDLGGRYKCPTGYDDEYSLRKIQMELINA